MTNQHFFEKEPSFIYVNFSQKFAKKFQYAKKFKIQCKISPQNSAKLKFGAKSRPKIQKKIQQNSKILKILHKKFEKI